MVRGIPYRESLIRNRYVGRTFILPKQKQRELAVKLKLNPMILQVKGKSLVLFDDSIVRGTTSSRIIKILREAGAREIHMRVGCPPIKSLCKLGIDMPTDKELIASSRNIEEIRKTKEREIPKKILQSPNKVVAAFLRGIFDAEGYVPINSKRKDRIIISQKNKNSLIFLKFVLSRLKITSSISHHLLFIYGKENLKKFYSLVPFLYPDKKERLRKF